MNDDLTHPESDAIARLVGDHLQQLSQRVNSPALIERVCRELPARAIQSSVKEPEGWSRSLALTLATTSAIVVAILGWRSVASSTALAATALRDVQIAHSQPIDRCYHVHFAPDPEYWNVRNPLKGPSDTVLWTRGDRFWANATLGSINLVYGRDEQGKVWVSSDRSTGIRLFNGDEKLPKEIDMYCAINSMTVPALVDNVLTDFDLRADQPPSSNAVSRDEIPRSGARNSVIWATLKPGHTHSLISSALLEVDETDTLVRLILWTVDEDRPRGMVSFTLVETTQIGDDQYRLASHLDADAQIKARPQESTPENTETPRDK